MRSECLLPTFETGGLALPAMAVGTYGITEGIATMLFESFPSETLLIDTAARYGNEGEIARALDASGWSRHDVVIIGKLARADQEQITVEKAIRQSIARLGCDYFDVYLIHSPRYPRFVETWKQMIQVRDCGLARCIGVSNFGTRELEALFEGTGVWPQVNQIPLSPFTDRCMRDIAKYCKSRNISVQASMPFGGEEACGKWGAVGATRQEWLQALYRSGILAVPGTKSVQHLLSNIAAYEPFLKRE